MIEHFTGVPIKPQDIPVNTLYVRLEKQDLGWKDLELIEFSSELSSVVADQTRTFIFDYHHTLAKTKNSVGTIKIFMTIFTVLLFVMSIFQLILSVEGNLKDNIWQMGVLRSMGMSKGDVYKLVLMEAAANMLASLALGILIGYLGTHMCMSVMMMMAEVDIENRVDWPVIMAMAAACIGATVLGTGIGVKVVNDRKIAHILKSG